MSLRFTSSSSLETSHEFDSPSNYNHCVSVSASSNSSTPTSPLSFSPKYPNDPNDPHDSQLHQGMLGSFGLRHPSRGLSERARLEALQRVHALVLDPYHHDLIHNHLAQVHSTGRRSALLDVGTGTGTWATEIANSQPFTDVLGIDVDWTAFGPGQSEHGNVDFQTVDITHPLPWARNHFDVIHVKGLLLDIPDYARLVERLAMILRPGGLLVLVESEPDYRSANGAQLPASVRTWEASVREAYSQQGIDTSLPSKLLGSVASSGVISTSPYCQQLGLPLGGYMRGDSNTLKKAGQIHASIIEANMRKVMPVLIGYGYQVTDLEDLLHSCISELTRSDAKYFQRLFAVYANKSG